MALGLKSSSFFILHPSDFAIANIDGPSPIWLKPKEGMCSNVTEPRETHLILLI